MSVYAPFSNSDILHGKTFSRRNILQMLVTRFHTNWLPKKIASEDPFPIPITFHVSSSIVSFQTFSFCRASSESDLSVCDVIETFEALKFFCLFRYGTKAETTWRAGALTAPCAFTTSNYRRLNLQCRFIAAVNLLLLCHILLTLSLISRPNDNFFFSSRLLLTASGDALTFLFLSSLLLIFLLPERVVGRASRIDFVNMAKGRN